MAIRRGQVLVIGLLVVVAASLWRTTSVEQEKRQIAAEYAKAQQLVNDLSQERAHLNEELSGTKETVESQAGDISSLQEELKVVQEQLDQTISEMASLQQEHAKLRQENSSLSTQMASLQLEKQQLEARLSSLKELRVAIRDVKRKMWEQRWASWRARVEAQKRADQEALASGNHGLVVRNGASTLGTSPQMHVHVLEPQSQ
jgi:chromosome segregation ATPase